MADTKYTFGPSDFVALTEDTPNLTTLRAAIAAAGLTGFLYAVNHGVSTEIWFSDPVDQPTLLAVVQAHTGVVPLPLRVVALEMPFDTVEAGVSRVVANGFPATEIQAGITGFAATDLVWPLKGSTELELLLKFILKASGTGSNVRLAAKVKAQSTGEDSSAAFSPDGFKAVPVSFTTLGEVFEGAILLDASGISDGDAVSLQVGRDGNNEMGAGTNDDVDVAIQIIAVRVGAR